MPIQLYTPPEIAPQHPHAPVFFELPVVAPTDDNIYFGKKKCCGKFRKKGKKMCKKCPGRN